MRIREKIFDMKLQMKLILFNSSSLSLYQQEKFLKLEMFNGFFCVCVFPENGATQVVDWLSISTFIEKVTQHSNTFLLDLPFGSVTYLDNQSRLFAHCSTFEGHVSQFLAFTFSIGSHRRPSTELASFSPIFGTLLILQIYK